MAERQLRLAVDQVGFHALRWFESICANQKWEHSVNWQHVGFQTRSSEFKS